MKTKVQLMIVMVAMCLTLGLQAQVRTITATETTGLNPDFTTLTDSVFGVICGPTNEDVTACNVSNPVIYSVPSRYINPNFVVAGGSFGVNMYDDVQLTVLSDQLYLLVGPAVNGMNSLQWCWDSDLEPNVNICQDAFQPQAFKNLWEYHTGTYDLTSYFTTSPVAVLAPGMWQVTALSESPEPSTFLMFG